MSSGPLRSIMLVAALALPSLFLTLSTASAQLVGTNVTGDLTVPGFTDLFDPAVGFVPSSGYENSSSSYDSPTVPISDSLVEFGAQFGNGTDIESADFTNTGLTLQYLLSNNFPVASDTFSFTDTAFSGLTLTELSDEFPGGVTASLVGDVLTLIAPDFQVNGTTTAVYSLSSPAPGTPEPGSIVLFAGLGFSSTLVLRRRRLRLSV
jgi:hypothetical protein